MICVLHSCDNLRWFQPRSCLWNWWFKTDGNMCKYTYIVYIMIILPRDWNWWFADLVATLTLVVPVEKSERIAWDFDSFAYVHKMYQVHIHEFMQTLSVWKKKKKKRRDFRTSSLKPMVAARFSRSKLRIYMYYVVVKLCAVFFACVLRSSDCGTAICRIYSWVVRMYSYHTFLK